MALRNIAAEKRLYDAVGRGDVRVLIFDSLDSTNSEARRQAEADRKSVV